MSVFLPKLITELKAQGLWGLKYTVRDDGKAEYATEVTTQQREAIAAVIASHDAGTAVLDAAKRARQDYINERRDAAITAGVVFNGVPYDTNRQSVIDLTSSVVFLKATRDEGDPVPNTISWRDANNVDRDLTYKQLLKLAEKIFTQVQTAHVIARQLKDAIQALNSVEAINRVDWP